MENGERRKVADIDFQNDKGIYNELAGEISAETAADVVYPTEISTSVILPGDNTAYIRPYKHVIRYGFQRYLAG